MRELDNLLGTNGIDGSGGFTKGSASFGSVKKVGMLWDGVEINVYLCAVLINNQK